MSYRKKLKKREHFAAILVTSNNCVPQPSRWQWGSFYNSLAQHIYATRLVERVTFMSQVTAKWLHRTLRKNMETPACHAGPRSNICENPGTRHSKPHVKTVAFTAFASAAAPSLSTLLFSRTRIFKVVLALQCSTAATAQRSKRLHACCHTTLHQRGQISTHREGHVRMRTT